MTAKDFKFVDRTLKYAKVLGVTIDAKDSLYVFGDGKIKACCESVEEVFGWLQCYAQEHGKEEEFLHAVYGEDSGHA
jgi:hypothetical protein